MKSSHILLILASILSFGVALFLAVISFVPEWSAAFDAGDALVSKPPLLLSAGLLMALVFGMCGLYGLSGAGVIRSLPLLRMALLGIGSICTMRGIAFVPQLLVTLGILPSPQAVSPRQTSQKVLITNLANWIQPFIRYEMGDSVTINPLPCA